MAARLYSPMEIEEEREKYRERISKMRDEIFTPSDMELLQEMRTDEDWFW